MKITAYNQHDVGSFSSPWSFRHFQSTRDCEPASLFNQAQREPARSGAEGNPFTTDTLSVWQGFLATLGMTKLGK